MTGAATNDYYKNYNRQAQRMRRFAAILCRPATALLLAIALFLSAIAPVGALPSSCELDGNHHPVEIGENFAAARIDHVDSAYGAPVDYCCLVACSPCKALAFADIDAAHRSNGTALLFAANDPASGTGAAPVLRPPQPDRSASRAEIRSVRSSSAQDQFASARGTN